MNTEEVNNTGWRGTDEATKIIANSELWRTSNINFTNSSGFSALPGGARLLNGAYLKLGSLALFWSSSEVDNANAWIRFLSNSQDKILRKPYFKRFGFSIRCVKD